MREENFVSRWSRRKQMTELKPDQNDRSLKGDITPQAHLTVEQEVKKETNEDRLEKLNALTDEDMPDLETLNENSDYSGFMSLNVSESLRKLALRKLFHGASFNIRDGLDEYDGDYTHFEKLDTSIITADMKHLLEVEAEKLLAKQEAEKQEAIEADVLVEKNTEELDESAKKRHDQIANYVTIEPNEEQLEIESIIKSDQTDLKITNNNKDVV